VALMKYDLIKSNAELRSYLGQFEERKYSIIALDIEAELHRHAYGERLCLVQVFDGTTSTLIDPFGIDQKLLKAFFENTSILKVIYDASSDQSLMKNAYDIGINSILDLRPAVDILGYEKKDLHSVIAAELGVNLTQKSKYQRYNWTRRPLDSQAVEYALNDVLHLLKLKDAILGRLCSEGQLDLFMLKNLQVQQKDYTRDPQDRYRRMKGYSRLAPEEKEVFRRAFDVREKYAKRFNMPSHNIISRPDLLELAANPEHINELRFPRRFSEGLVRRILKELEGAVRG
jgi:ribonuclease D